MPRHRLPRVACLHQLLALLPLSLVVLSLSACSKPASRELQPGSYRATVELPGDRQVPFGLDVAQEESGTVLYLVNGDERVPLELLQAAIGQLTAKVPGYETTLTAKIAGADLSGHVALVHPGGQVLELPFAAKLGATWRFYPEALPDNADFEGRWSVTFTDDRGRTSQGIALFEQEFSRVTGTVLTPAGDQRFLAGEAHDEELRLSRFDGGAVVLYTGKLDAMGRLVGEFWTDRDGRQRFVAGRDPDAALAAAAPATRIRDPEAGLSFAFRDLDGQTVSSADPRFAGKVWLVTLAGSWCPNSHDEAALLTALDRKYRSQGLEIVSLMFEQHADFERAVAAVRRFRAARGIEYSTLIAGVADKVRAAAALPQLEAVAAYPTTLFVDRTGRIRRIHTGFAGPATGVDHERLVQDFTATIENLLAETASPPAASTAP